MQNILLLLLLQYIMSSSPKSDESPVLLLMIRRLPVYIVAAKYDEKETISRMYISENQGNSISKIKQYIQRNLVTIMNSYIYDSSMLPLSFEFPLDIVIGSAIKGYYQKKTR